MRSEPIPTETINAQKTHNNGIQVDGVLRDGVEQNDKSHQQGKHSAGILNVIKIMQQYWIGLFLLLSVVLLTYAVIHFNDNIGGTYPVNEAYFQTQIDDPKNIQEAISLINESWQKVEMFNFRDVNNTVWLKIPLSPAVARDNTFLRFSDPLIDKLDIYIVRNGEQGHKVDAHFNGGDSLPFSIRKFALPNTVVPIGASSLPTTIYIAGSSKISVNFEVSIWKSADFIEFNDKYTTFFGLMLGYVLALVCYCLMMFTTARKIEYMWYCIYLLCFASHILALSGYGFQYLWPNATGLQSIISGATISLIFAGLTKFTESLLMPNSVVYKRVFKGLIYCHLTIAILGFISFDTRFVALSIFTILVSTLIMPIFCLLMKGVNSTVKKLCFGIWFILFCTCFFSLFDKFSLLPTKADPLFILVIGFHLETMLIGIALIYQYRISYIETYQLRESALLAKQKARQSKDELLALQNDSQRKLEAQVKLQTAQLENALKDLNVASFELESMRNLDGLTGLPNRLAFEESLDKLAKKAIDARTALSIAVIDIDHFKQVNDTYGHLAGDECLRVFSHLLKQMFSLEDYLYCRFGGEEFLLASILPASEVEHQLNQFRLAVQQLHIESGANTITFTTSAGLGVKYLVNREDVRKLTSMADNNLYEAKQKGRNLVVA